MPVRFTRENIIEPTANDEESVDSTDTDSQHFFESSQEEEPRRSQKKRDVVDQFLTLIPQMEI